MIAEHDTLEILHPKSSVNQISQYNLKLNKIVEELQIPFSDKDAAVFEQITFKPIKNNFNEKSEESKVEEIDSCINLNKP